MAAYRGKLKTRDGYLTLPDDADVVDIDGPSHPKAGKSRVKRTFTFWSKRHSDPLFAEGTVTVESIHQRTLGDCWFLAGVAAIVSHPLGSQILKSTMVDCGDGHVIVRLYDGDLVPRFIRVEKSRASYMGTNIGVGNVTKTGMWPVVLEKAGCCFTGEGRKAFTPNALSYANIQGGHSDQVFRMLLGKDSESTPINPKPTMGSGSADAWNTFLNIGPAAPPTVAERAAYAKIFGDSIPIDVYRKNHAREVKKILREGSTDTVAETKALIQKMPAPVRGPIGTFVDREMSSSGQIGSGSYSDGDRGVFETIAKALKSRRPVAFMTNKDIGKSEGVGRSAGESMSKGMVGNHVYAVIDTFQETAMLRRRFIKASNPWGDYGRGYTDSGLTLTSSEQDAGIFWLELRDFITLAPRYYIGPSLTMEMLMS